MKKTKCVKVQIPKEACYIYFGERKEDDYDVSGELGYTNRGEQVFVDFNKEGEIIGIELLGSDEAPKPCQGGMSDE